MPRDAIDLEASYSPAEIEAEWIAILDDRLGWLDRPRSYRLIGAVMRALHATSGSLDARELLRSVGTDFRPDRLDNPIAAVLATLDVLEDEIDDARLEGIRSALIRLSPASSIGLPRPTWSAIWSAPA